MKLLLFFTLLIFFTMSQANQRKTQKEEPCTGSDISLESFKWENRILVLFSPDSESESYQNQWAEFSSREEGLRDRDLIVISIFENECSRLKDDVISDSASLSIRERLDPPESDYSIFLIGKDGTVKLRQQEILETDELFRVIDRMPMRQREMREDDKS